NIRCITGQVRASSPERSRTASASWPPFGWYVTLRKRSSSSAPPAWCCARRSARSHRLAARRRASSSCGSRRTTRWWRSPLWRGSKRATPKSERPQLDWGLAARPRRRSDHSGRRGGHDLEPAPGKARPGTQQAIDVGADAAPLGRRAPARRAGRNRGPLAAVPAPLALASPSAGDRADAVLREAPSVGAMSEGFAHQAVEDAVARERARIARELHDGIATDLAGAISLFKLYLEKHKSPDETLDNVFDIMQRSLQR